MSHRNEPKGHPLLVIAVVVVIAVIVGGGISAYLFLGYTPKNPLTGTRIAPTCPSGELYNTQTHQCVSAGNTNVNNGNGQVQGELYGTVQDAVTSANLGGTSAKLDVINPANLAQPLETITVSTSTKTFTSSHLYAAGETLLVHAYSTEGNGYYDANFNVTVPSSTVLIGSSQVFNLGAFSIENRASSSSVTYTLLSPSQAVLSTATGSTAATSITMYSAAATTFTLSYAISDTGLSTCWGCSLSVLASSSNGFALQKRVSVGWMAFNNTAVNQGDLQADGWTTTSNPPSGYLVMYKVISPISSTSVKQASTTDSFTVDTSSIASSTKLGFWLWFQDVQLPSDAAKGIADGAPSAAGAYSAYGLTAKIGIGYTTPARIITSSAGGALLATVITTH